MFDPNESLASRMARYKAESRAKGTPADYKGEKMTNHSTLVRENRARVYAQAEKKGA